MESNKKYVIGLDFGTDSCRALVVDTYTGREMATGVSFYPRWKAGLYCDAHNNRYRQHPLDYIESMIEAVHIALSDLKEEEIASICGLCFDTTGSTPALTDKAGMPLALCPEFAEEPDAMFILWKDHTAVREAEQINALINKRNLDYLLYEGGTYSSEWVWSKVLHIINTNVAIKDAAYAWVEHCDWMTGLVTGNTIPEQIFRSRCAAGHKAMWHASWGLPSGEVLEELNPALKEMLPHLFTETHTSDTKEVYNALQTYAVVNHPKFGKIYAFEIDGFGSAYLSDDANVPNLLALPYLGGVDSDDAIYANTRRFVWSEYNPYFFKGSYFEGIGGHHIGTDMIWPMSLIMKALTAQDDKELQQCIQMLQKTHAGTGFMHESFHKDDPKKFTRSWFAWANTLFGELLWKTFNEKPYLLEY